MSSLLQVFRFEVYDLLKFRVGRGNVLDHCEVLPSCFDLNLLNVKRFHAGPQNKKPFVAFCFTDLTINLLSTSEKSPF